MSFNIIKNIKKEEKSPFNIGTYADYRIYLNHEVIKKIFDPDIRIKVRNIVNSFQGGQIINTGNVTMIIGDDANHKQVLNVATYWDNVSLSITNEEGLTTFSVNQHTDDKLNRIISLSEVKLKEYRISEEKDNKRYYYDGNKYTVEDIKKVYDANEKLTYTEKMEHNDSFVYVNDQIKFDPKHGYFDNVLRCTKEYFLNDDIILTSTINYEYLNNERELFEYYGICVGESNGIKQFTSIDKELFIDILAQQITNKKVLKKVKKAKSKTLGEKEWM